ncbi:MAG: IclR family transcriptional regulator [Allobranchiibius sp.]
MPTPPRSSSPIATAMAVLRCFSPDRQLLGVVEIADEIGMNKSSVSRMLNTLEAEELVERDPATKKYSLGLGLLSVAGALLAQLDARRAAQPVLARLTAETGETSSLMLWDGTAAVTVEQVPSTHPIKHSAELGTRYATVASSSVRVFLAAMTVQARESALAEAADGSSYDHLAADDRDGVAVNFAQTSSDEVGISAGAYDHRGELAAAVLISAPRYRVDDDRAGQLRAACQLAAADLTVRLGGPSCR